MDGTQIMIPQEEYMHFCKLEEINEELVGENEELVRNMEEITQIMKCDADAETKCKMVSEIVNGKSHYFKSKKLSKSI